MCSLFIYLSIYLFITAQALAQLTAAISTSLGEELLPLPAGGQRGTRQFKPHFAISGQLVNRCLQPAEFSLEEFISLR